MENREKPKANLRIVREDDPVEKQKIEVGLGSDSDLIVFEKMENIDQISDESRKDILDKLKQLLKQVENLNNSDDKVRFNLVLSLRIYNQMYRFEVDEDKKEKIKQGIGQIEFAIRQLLLS